MIKGGDFNFPLEGRCVRVACAALTPICASAAAAYALTASASAAREKHAVRRPTKRSLEFHQPLCSHARTHSIAAQRSELSLSLVAQTWVTPDSTSRSLSHTHPTSIQWVRTLFFKPEDCMLIHIRVFYRRFQRLNKARVFPAFRVCSHCLYWLRCGISALL
jgi:hypothetical protein